MSTPLVISDRIPFCLDEQLGRIFTQILAIPLADSLPTPNARKTCALAIWLIQVQRLPECVLEPAKDRIAYALRRGIEGELGKEGKKGSVSDGLKVLFTQLTPMGVLTIIRRLYTTSPYPTRRRSSLHLLHYYPLYSNPFSHPHSRYGPLLATPSGALP